MNKVTFLSLCSLLGSHSISVVKGELPKDVHRDIMLSLPLSSQPISSIRRVQALRQIKGTTRMY